MKKFIKYFLLFIIPCIIVSVSIFVYFNLNIRLKGLNIQSLPTLSLNDVVKFSRFTLEKAPSETLVGEMSALSGEVKYEPRLATEAATISKPVKVQQGDIIETGEDGEVTVTFSGASEIKLTKSSRTEIVQTLPANLVFWHKKGTVIYKKLGEFPVSIRAMRLLIEISGDVEITYNPIEPAVTLVAIRGPVKVVFNNTDNETQVINLEEGKTLDFNNDKRRPLIINN